MDTQRGHQAPHVVERLEPSACPSLPFLLTTGEVATLLRTSRKAVYAMVEREQLPGVVRLGRRVLVQWDDRLHWLRHKSAPSPLGILGSSIAFLIDFVMSAAPK